MDYLAYLHFGITNGPWSGPVDSMLYFRCPFPILSGLCSKSPLFSLDIVLHVTDIDPARTQNEPSIGQALRGKSYLGKDDSSVGVISRNGCKLYFTH